MGAWCLVGTMEQRLAYRTALIRHALGHQLLEAPVMSAKHFMPKRMLSCKPLAVEEPHGLYTAGLLHALAVLSCY